MTNALTRAGKSRLISRYTGETMALVLAGGKGSRLYELTDWRAKPAMPFGGKFRIIDFPLSNCVNSGIRRIGVLTQYKSHSLIRHLVSGWSGFQHELGEFVEVLPASQRTGAGWYEGTADAVYQNLDIIRTHQPNYVLILSGDHIYKMDYGPMLAWHAEREADMTISCLEVPIEEAAGAFGVMEIEPDGRIIGFQEKPENPTPMPGRDDVCLASMGNYVFNTDFLYEQLIRDADTSTSDHDFGKNLIPDMIEKYRIYAFPFRDEATGKRAYWRDVGTLDAYWEANQELVSISPELNLYDSGWPIMTYQAQLPPAKFVHNNDRRRGMAVDSMVSGGCVISGSKIDRSLLFSNCTVRSYSKVSDSVLLPDVEIKRNCDIRNAIIDRGCIVPEGTTIGVSEEEDLARNFRITKGGHVLVTPQMLGQDLHFLR